MDETALDWLFYALALLVFIVISTMENRRAQRREARAREAVVQSPIPVTPSDPHAWGHGGPTTPEAASEWSPGTAGTVPAPGMTPTTRYDAQQSVPWRVRLREKGRLRDAVVMTTLLGPCASLERRRDPPHDSP